MCECVNLQSLGPVDGPQWSEHTQNSQDFHHINCTGPEKKHGDLTADQAIGLNTHVTDETYLSGWNNTNSRTL